MTVSRRSMLAGAAAAVALPGSAAVIDAPTAAAELPVTKVNRIAWELAHAMDEWCADIGYDGKPDSWKAHVMPAGQTEWAVYFEHLPASRSLREPSPRLLDLEAKWKKARAAEDRSCGAMAKAETRCRTMKPEAPARPKPDHLTEAQLDMTLRQHGDKTHPVNVELAAFYADEKAAREAWSAECEAIEEASGLNAAIVRHSKAIERSDRALHALLACPARNLAGVRLKLAALEEHYGMKHIDANGIWEYLADDLSGPLGA